MSAHNRLKSALLASLLLTAACGKSEEELRIDDVMIDPIEETSVEVCNSNQPCVVDLNEAGEDGGIY